MRLLMLANVVPYPPHGGVHLRLFHLLTRIARQHEVTLGCHSWGDEDLEGARWLTRNGVRTVTAPLRAANPRHVVPALGALLARRPPELVQFTTPGLRALVVRERCDVLQIEETLLAPYAAALPAGSPARTVLTLHNVHFVQEPRIAALEPRRRDRLWRRANGAMMRRYEPQIARRFDRCVAVSEADRAALLGEAPDLRIDVLPNGVDTRALAPLPAPPPGPAIVFVGTLNYRPCVDAAVWLVGAIVPILRRRFADLAVWIVGKQPPPELLALAGDAVHVTGHVPDVAPYYARAAVAVVPLRAGGGSRLKILEAMALGRPVVSTAIGAEGLDVSDGRDIVIADDAESFAARVGELLARPDRARELAANARRLVEQRYDWEAIAARQLAIYDELLDGVPARKRHPL